MRELARVTVLGSCAGWSEPGRACAAHLLEHRGFRVLVDCGAGALPALLREVGPHAEGLDAVVLTALTPDHAAGLSDVYRLRASSAGSRHDVTHSLPLLGGPQTLHTAITAAAGDVVGVRTVFDFRDVSEGVGLGPWWVTAHRLHPHVGAVGFRFVSDEVAVAFSGPTGLRPELGEFGNGAHVLVLDCADRRQHAPDSLVPDDPWYLNARQAGGIADAVGARSLLLTRFWPGSDRLLAEREAAAAFGGPVFAATEGLALEVVSDWPEGDSSGRGSERVRAAMRL